MIDKRRCHFENKTVNVSLNGEDTTPTRFHNLKHRIDAKGKLLNDVNKKLNMSTGLFRLSVMSPDRLVGSSHM